MWVLLLFMIEISPMFCLDAFTDVKALDALLIPSTYKAELLEIMDLGEYGTSVFGSGWGWLSLRTFLSTATW